MAVLRDPVAGCPWDLKQTHQTLRAYLLEETYEAVEALDRGDLDALRGELGDVLLQCVFHAQLAREAGRFDAADVAGAITAKLIRRHPHIFTATGRPLSPAARARTGIDSPQAVKERWASIKAAERAAAGETPGVLAGIPRALPALLRAQAIGSRARSVGFDWPDVTGVLDKIDEELRELREAVRESPARAADELGDVLFTLATLAWKLHVEPEAALAQANDKFTRRFERLEALMRAAGRPLQGASLEELDAVWQRVKAEEQAPTPSRARSRRSTSGRTPRHRRSPR